MDQGRADVVKTITQEREKLGENIAELTDRLQSASDWRNYFAAHTWSLVGLAVGAGILISGMFRRSGH